MVQVIALGLVGGLAWYAYRALKRQMAAIGEELEKAEKARKGTGKSTKTIDELELGPDGVYRPKREIDDQSGTEN